MVKIRLRVSYTHHTCIIHASYMYLYDVQIQSNGPYCHIHWHSYVLSERTFLEVNTTFLLFHRTFSTCFDLTLQVIVRPIYSVFMSHFWVTDNVTMRFEVLKNANGILRVGPEETGHLEDRSFERRLQLNVRYRNCVKMWAGFVRVGELHDLSCSRHITRVKTARRMRWVAQVTRMGETINAYRVQDVISTDCTLISNSWWEFF